MSSPRIQEQLDAFQEQGLWREFRVVESASGPTIRILARGESASGGDGREFLNLSSNNYLGLANHPTLIRAAVEATERYGTGAGASRYLSGNHALYAQLEEIVARWKGAEACLVFSSGYAANLGILGSLVGPGDLVVLDKLVHASLIDGARLSGATVRVYPHVGLEKLERLLAGASANQRKLIVTDGVFSMDGDLAPIPHLVSLAKQYDALLLVDDAHATGVLGAHGAGSFEHWGLQPEGFTLQMGTFSKALGSLGGFVAGSQQLIDLIRNRARALIYSTALPAGVLAASLAAVELVQHANELRQRLYDRATQWREGLQRLGFNTMNSHSHIVPILVGSIEAVLRMSRQLEENGIFAPAIRPPTVPPKMCRIRTSVMAVHTHTQLEEALRTFSLVRQATAREMSPTGLAAASGHGVRRRRTSEPQLWSAAAHAGGGKRPGGDFPEQSLESP